MIRRFEHTDTVATAKVWLRSGLDEYKYLPTFQSLNEFRALAVFTTVIAKQCDIWVYERNGKIAGFLALNGSYIDRLYVDPNAQKLGIGAALLAHAKSLCPEGLQLHTHQQNQRARSFYEKFGFVAVKFGTSPPPESAPDVEYHWYGQRGD